MTLRVTALFLSVGMFVASARASDVDLAWRAPTRGCPEREALLNGLGQRLQRPITVGPEAGVRVVADVVHEASGYLLSLRIDSKQGTEQRNLRALGCNELAQATVLITALFITNDADAHVKAPPTAASTETAQRLWYVRAQLIGVLGTFPIATLGPGVMFGVALGDVRVELGGTHIFSQELRLAGMDAPVGRMQLTTAAAAACYGLVRRPFLAPCLIGELGRLAASGDNLRERQDRTLLWAMAGASARASLELLGWLRWQAELAAGFPWDHAQFGVHELGSAHRVASVVARLSTGLEGVF